MTDPVRAAEQREAIKEHTTPTYKREEQLDVPNDFVAPVASFLGIESPNAAEKDKLAYIKGKIEASGEGDFLFQLKGIEQKLNAPKLGQTRLDVVYNFMRAKAAVEDAKKLRDAYLSS